MDRRLKQPNLPLNIGERQSGMEASNEIEPHIDDESDDETPPEVLLAQERVRLAQLREQRDELERKLRFFGGEIENFGLATNSPGSVEMFVDSLSPGRGGGAERCAGFAELAAGVGA